MLSIILYWVPSVVTIEHEVAASNKIGYTLRNVKRWTLGKGGIRKRYVNSTRSNRTFK